MKSYSRRNFIKAGALTSVGSALAGNTLLSCTVKPTEAKKGILRIDPTPRFEIAPTLFMQFLEPLGITDSAIEAAWDYGKDNWREDLVKCVADLSPGMIRWGGNYTRYYKWREGIGPAEKRPWLYNCDWGGKETNRVGTHEFMDFCRRVEAEPLICINFMSDGFKEFKISHGQDRYGTVDEAAEWVSYCNDPDNRDRKKNGEVNPFSVKYWQIGNETSYGGNYGFTLDQAIVHTREFAKAMRKRDPSIKLIGWGDVPDIGRLKGNKGEEDNEFWASKMIQENGDFLDMIAIHMMGVNPEKTRALIGFEYFNYPEEAWNEFLELAKIAEYRLSKLKGILQNIGCETKIAVTEGHLSLSPHNTNTILQSWLSAAYHARTLNTYLRNADRVSICTGADFFGTRWTVNAVKLPVPKGESYLLPIGTIMKLYKKHGGDKGVVVTESPAELDVAATRKGDKIFLHILNTHFSNPVKINVQIDGYSISSASAHEIAPSNKMAYVDDTRHDTFKPVDKKIADTSELTIQPASVNVIELQLKKL
ncbi:MAG: hypothetical protein JXB49_24140 [Bacteroidales bacterium]|nr:hypothetical protein [Bacteroidales bacterium]